MLLKSRELVLNLEEKNFTPCLRRHFVGILDAKGAPGAMALRMAHCIFSVVRNSFKKEKKRDAKNLENTRLLEKDSIFKAFFKMM